MPGLRIVVVLCLALAIPGSAWSAIHQPLLTGLYLAQAGTERLSPSSYAQARAAGTSVVRIAARWSLLEPSPPTSDGADPLDASYEWTWLDRQVRLATNAGLEPLVSVFDAPMWAQATSGASTDGNWRVDVARFHVFAEAIAKRYGGTYAGVPRVTYWEAWNEPNVNVYLGPQFANGRPWAPERYRELVNAFASAVHAVHRDNVVVAGGLSPFTVKRGDTVTIGPLRFMAEMLCMSLGAHPHPTCSRRAAFDVWSHHPYTSGGPTHHANNPDDVSLGDLPKMQNLLMAAYRAHHILTTHTPGFWVTEFSWDTKPPDPYAVPIALQARWTSEALHQMWLDGVSVVIWLQLRDDPYPGSSFQAGLYFVGGKPKPTLTAFRFPFVAYLGTNGITVWGRTPAGMQQTVLVQQRRAGTGWRTIARLRSDRYGVFSGTLRVSATPQDVVRATLSGTAQSSLPFSLTVPPDHFYNPFGGGG